MQQFPIRNLKVQGELRARIIKNFSRLHSKEYLPGTIGLTPYCSEGWAGDWEGRTILALALHQEVLETEAAYLDEIVAWTHSICNEQGYRGELLDLNRINEQMYPSNGWLMRGLIEYHRQTGKDWILDWIHQILDNLFLPILPNLDNYPQKPEDRQIFERGKVAGMLVSHFNEWLLSSDIGCLFISLDGLTCAYEYTKRKDLLPLIERMITLFTSQNFTEDILQTHACLTGMRGVMRAYRQLGKKEYLDAVIDFFEIYKRYGMSEWFANFDWFSTPSWSEPCGVIDSYMLALQLWQETGQKKYLDDAMHIWYNGVLGGQRSNGGFGCDSCAEDGWVHTTDFYEAYWCCTMRGGEGLNVPIRNAVFRDENAFVFPLYLDGEFSLDDGIILQERSGMPEEGKITFKLLSGVLSAHFKLFIPEFAREVQISMNGATVEFREDDGFASFQADMKEGDSFVLAFDMPIRIMPTVGRIHDGDGLHTVRKGPLVLLAPHGCIKALKAEDFSISMEGKIEAHGRNFEPLYNNYLRSEMELKALRRQLLFLQAQHK